MNFHYPTVVEEVAKDIARKAGRTVPTEKDREKAKEEVDRILRGK